MRLLATGLVVAALGGCADDEPSPPISTPPRISRTTPPAPPRPVVVVPDVIGMTTTEAAATLARVGLLFVVNETRVERDDNTVLDQFPESGAEVPAGSVVAATGDCRPSPCPEGPPDLFLRDPCTCDYA